MSQPGPQPGQPPVESHPAAMQPEPAAGVVKSEEQVAVQDEKQAEAGKSPIDPADQGPTTEDATRPSGSQAQAADSLDQMGEATGGAPAADSGPPPDPGPPISGEVRVDGDLAAGGLAEITAEYSDKDTPVSLHVDAPQGPTCDKCGQPGPPADTSSWHHTGRGSPWRIRVALTRAGRHMARLMEGDRVVHEAEFDVAEAAAPAADAPADQPPAGE